MTTWSGRDVEFLEKEVRWLTGAGISTILNRRIFSHAELYAGDRTGFVDNLRACSGVICGLAAADILMGNWNPVSAMVLLFPAGKMQEFAQYLLRREGYRR
jgi:hypothetical protein